MMKSGMLEKNRNKNEIYLIAETAFSHEGSLEYLIHQIDMAVEAGVDAIKFQIMLEPEESYSREVIEASEVFKWIYTQEQWKDLILYAREKGLQVVVLPIDMRALEFCEKNVQLYEMIEVHSINFNHKFMLERMNLISDKILILGEGGRTLADIEYALSKLWKAYSEKRILLMHGFQSFPTEPENLKMGRIRKYKEFFDVEVGYADHTSYNADDTALMQIAYINGARFFEKHLVLEKGVERTDYQAAVDSVRLKELRIILEQIKVIQGEEFGWSLNDAEVKYRGREKKIVALSEIHKGTVLTSENVGYKVTNETKWLEQSDMDRLLGTVAKNTISLGSTEIS